MHHRQGSPSTPGSLFLQGPLGEDPDTLHPHLGELRADLEPIRDLLIGPSIESGTAGGLLRNEQLAGKIPCGRTEPSAGARPHPLVGDRIVRAYGGPASPEYAAVVRSWRM
jgi:hypothetical protein